MWSVVLWGFGGFLGSLSGFLVGILMVKRAFRWNPAGRLCPNSLLRNTLWSLAAFLIHLDRLGQGPYNPAPSICRLFTSGLSAEPLPYQNTARLQLRGQPNSRCGERCARRCSGSCAIAVRRFGVNCPGLPARAEHGGTDLGLRRIGQPLAAGCLRGLAVAR